MSNIVRKETLWHRRRSFYYWSCVCCGRWKPVGAYLSRYDVSPPFRIHLKRHLQATSVLSEKEEF